MSQSRSLAWLMTSQPNIHAMLGAFLGGPYRDWWLLNVEEPGMITPLESHWLVRQSAHSAFARGLLKLDRLAPSMIEVSWTSAFTAERSTTRLLLH